MIIDNPSPRHIPALRRIWQQAFGDCNEFLDAFFETGFSYDRCRCIFSEGEPVAAVYLFECQWQEKKIGYLFALAVEKSHQKQGLSRLLLSDTHAWLQQRGFSGVIMEPASESLTVYYQRLGYRPFGGRTEQEFHAGELPTAAVQLGDLNYEQTRNRLLPSNAVRQEGEFTKMLHTQADFYGCEDFAAAVSHDRSRIFEFLGDIQHIPRLLAQLNIQKATVRLPGGEPTAVYLSFSGKDIPGYFGLPLSTTSLTR